MQYVVIGGSLVLVAGLTGVAVFLPFFWAVFTIPALVLVVVQYLALRWPAGHAKDRFFVCIDFLYYIIFAGIIGTASVYLSDLKDLRRYSAKLTYEAAEAELPGVVEAQAEAQQAADRADELLAGIDQAAITDCLTQWMLQRRQPTDEQPHMVHDYPPGCEAALGILEIAIKERDAYQTLTKRRADLELIIAGGPEPASVAEDLSDESRAFWLFQVFPCFGLVAVALKIGKTTHALLPR
jgi:hypothetical protein